jgi:single-stranded DNA-binding protein
MQVIGTISTEPQLRQVGENTVCNFNLVVNQGKGDKRKALFLRCAAWNGLGDVVANYAHKGDVIKVNTEWLDLSVYNNNTQADITITRVNLIPTGRRDAANGNDSAQPVEDIPF